MSDPSPLSFPDYDQLASDHRRLLVLVRPVGEAVRLPSGSDSEAPSLFQRLWDAATAATRFPIEDEALTQVPLRPIEARFLEHYPQENNEWSEFQAHRGVLGIVSAGVARSSEERTELVRLHENIKVKEGHTQKKDIIK